MRGMTLTVKNFYPEVVRKARALEIEWKRKMHVCERDPARSAEVRVKYFPRTCVIGDPPEDPGRRARSKQ